MENVYIYWSYITTHKPRKTEKLTQQLENCTQKWAFLQMYSSDHYQLQKDQLTVDMEATWSPNWVSTENLNTSVLVGSCNL